MALSKKGFCLLISIFMLFNNAYPFFYQQDQNPDSLLKKANASSEPAIGLRFAKQALINANTANNKSAIIRSLNLIAEFYGDLRRYDSTRVYAQKALSEAEQCHIDSFKGSSFIYLGNADYGAGVYKQAIQNYQRAAVEYKRINKLPDVGTSYVNIGISERMLSKFTDAISYFILASAIFEKSNDFEYLAHTYTSIASCYDDLHNYNKSIEYNKKALTIRQKLKDKETIAESLNNVGFDFYKKNQPDSAINYLSRSFDIVKHQKDSVNMVLVLQNLGSSWKIKGDLGKAGRYISRSLIIGEKYDMTEELSRGNVNMAEVYLRQKKYANALLSVDKAIGPAEKRNLKELLAQAYTVKYNIYKQTGDFKNALLFADKKDAANEVLFDINSNNKIGELEIQYKTAQLRKDMDALSSENNLKQKILNQQKTSIIVLAIAAVLLAALFAIAYNNFRIKNKANQRIQTLMRDLHHRVKNNLQILSGLFTMQIDNLSDENTKAALRENEARLTSMNLIHNKLYLDNTTTKIEMNDYLTKLLNHIKDSFGGYKQSEINLRIEVSNIMLEADKAVAIGLIANELTTNAFKYAFNGQVQGEIHLALQLVEKSKILLTLGDNGVGLKAENKDKAPSFGLKLVNLMARQLNSTLVVNNNNGVFYQMEISI